MIASRVRVKLVDDQQMSQFWRGDLDQAVVAQLLLELGNYRDAGEFAVEGTGEAAAEEVFDLTNNPGRQQEREQLYGRQRSLSVGDIVEVEGDLWLCATEGWEKLTGR